MMQVLSLDLRERIINSWQQGQAKAAMAQLFMISLSSAKITAIDGQRLVCSCCLFAIGSNCLPIATEGLLMMHVNIDDPIVFSVVSLVCRDYGVGCVMPNDRQCLKELFSNYGGSEDIREFEVWLQKKLPIVYSSVNKRPIWLQNPEWPFANEKPMVFVGQIDIGAENTPDFDKYFHDYTSFYTFMPQGRGIFTVVMQQI